MDSPVAFQTPHRSVLRYRREIDGLRAVAVLPVVFFHSGFSWFTGGYVGVDVFFVISGYLITSLMIEESRAGTFTITGFYERRARRILPALITVVIATTLMAFWWLTPPELETYGESVASVAVFLSNFYFAEGTGYFETGVMFKPLLHTWSLAVEEQYYLFAPPIFLLLWKRGFWAAAAATVLLAIASFLFALWAGQKDVLANFFFTPSRIWEIMLGALAAFAFARADVSRAMRPVIGEVLAIAGLGLIAIAVLFFTEKTPFPGYATLAPTVGALLIILFAHEKTVVGRLLSLPPIVGIGLISYSAYLWHWPLIAFGEVQSGGATPGSISWALIALTFVLAYVSWRTIEQPFRNRRFLAHRTILSGATASLALTLAAGAAMVFSHGIPARYGEPEYSYFKSFDALSDFRSDCTWQRVVSMDTLGPCIVGDRTKPPSIIFWGDSHSEAIASGMGEMLKQRGVSGYIYALGLCPAIPGIMRGRGEHYDGRCARRNKEIFDIVAADPNIKHVVIAGWWRYYGRWKDFRPDAGLPGVAPCLAASPPAGEGIDDALRLTFCALEKQGKSITILRQVPTAPLKRIEAMFNHGTRKIAATNFTFPMPREKYDTQFLNPLFDKMASSGVPSFDAYAGLCDAAAGTCPLIKNGLPIYRDINHVTTVGAALLGEQLLELILRN